MSELSDGMDATDLLYNYGSVEVVCPFMYAEHNIIICRFDFVVMTRFAVTVVEFV